MKLKKLAVSNILGTNIRLVLHDDSGMNKIPARSLYSICSLISVIIRVKSSKLILESTVTGDNGGDPTNFIPYKQNRIS